MEILAEKVHESGSYQIILDDDLRLIYRTVFPSGMEISIFVPDETARKIMYELVA
jgi:hypothetical protein